MKRELLVFLVVGILTVVIDWLVYRGCMLAAFLHADLAKTAGFISGMCFGYIVNRKWTFSYGKGNISTVSRFVLLYGISLILNVGINRAVLHLAGKWQINGMAAGIMLAFLIATGCSACFNFIGMKWFVFRKRS